MKCLNSNIYLTKNKVKPLHIESRVSMLWLPSNELECCVVKNVQWKSLTHCKLIHVTVLDTVTLLTFLLYKMVKTDYGWFVDYEEYW